MRRQVHADQRKAVAPTLGQQRFLHAPGKVELAAHARLLHQFMGHARIVDGQRGRCRDQAQDLGIIRAERTAGALVDHFQRTDRPLGRGQWRAQQAARDEAGIRIVAAINAGIAERIGDDLVAVLRNGAADHALAERNAQAGDVDRTDADLAFEHVAVFLEEEQRGGLGIHEIGNAGDRFAQGLAQVEGNGQGFGEIGEKGERARFAGDGHRHGHGRLRIHSSLRSVPRRARCSRQRRRPHKVMIGPDST